MFGAGGEVAALAAGIGGSGGAGAERGGVTAARVLILTIAEGD